MFILLTEQSWLAAHKWIYLGFCITKGKGDDGRVWDDINTDHSQVKDDYPYRILHKITFFFHAYSTSTSQKSDTATIKERAKRPISQKNSYCR